YLSSHFIYFSFSSLIISSLSIFSFFFFQCSGDHRDLHSFPTRRSSDLVHLAAPDFVDVSGHRDEPRLFDDNPQHLNDIIISVEKDRKSTRLNSSHVAISYAVFCLKKKKKKNK